jgi:hypothetical protein
MSFIEIGSSNLGLPDNLGSKMVFNDIGRTKMQHQGELIHVLSERFSGLNDLFTRF